MSEEPRKSLVMEFTFPPGLDLIKCVEHVKNIVLAADDYHRSLGGEGLVLTDVKVMSASPVPVPEAWRCLPCGGLVTFDGTKPGASDCNSADIQHGESDVSRVSRGTEGVAAEGLVLPDDGTGTHD